MRRLPFISAALVLTIAACNNSGDKTTAATDTTTASKDSMPMDHHMDSASGIAALPAVPAGAKVYFKNLKNGQTITSPFKVEMGVDGIKLDTAGPVVAGSGHHHLLIDAGDSIPAGSVVPKDATHMHFGKAQTEAPVTLSPGKHVLTLQYADGAHRSYGGQLTATVNVTVK